MFCSHCGAALTQAPGFCPNCGQPLAASAPPAKKSRAGLGCLIALVAFLALCALIALPDLLAERRRNSESMAANTLGTLHNAERLYAQRYPAVGFTCDLYTLRRANLISSDLAYGVRNGYRFQLRNCREDKSGGPVTQYQILARPVNRGWQVLCSDQTLTLRSIGADEGDCLTTGRSLH